MSATSIVAMSSSPPSSTRTRYRLLSRSMSPFTASPARLTVVRDDTSHGVLRLMLDPGSYAWEFLPVPGAAFTDSGAASCH